MEPYQNYTVAVWAYTSIGQGKKYTFTVMTSVAGRLSDSDFPVKFETFKITYAIHSYSNLIMTAK